MRDGQLKKVISALDALILVEQVKLGQELAENSRLRKIQLGIAADEKRAFESVHGFEKSDAVMHAFRQARVRKLRTMQTELQPDLARAALRRETAKGELKRLMRQRLAVQLKAKALKAKAANEECGSSGAQALFMLMKRL